MEAHVPGAAGAAAVACPARQNPTTSIPLLCSLLSIMASECESGDAMAQHQHLRPDGTEPLARIAVDYTPDACHHARASGEIHVTYDHRGGARWRSPRRFLPGGAVAAAVRAPAGDTAGLNYNLYLSSLEGSLDMDGWSGRRSGARGSPGRRSPCSCTPPCGTRAGSTRGGGPAPTTAATRPTSAATEMSGCPSRSQWNTRKRRKMKNVKIVGMPETRLMPPPPPAALLLWRWMLPELVKIRNLGFVLSVTLVTIVVWFQLPSAAADGNQE